MNLLVADAHGREIAHTDIRDPSAATNQVVYQSPGQHMIPQWDAANALAWGYYANVFVYRCVQIRATTISRIPFRVGADPSKPLDYDRRNPLARLLSPPPGGPNMTTSARQLWAWTIAQWLVTGRFAWELELGPGDRPIALWPLPSPYLKPIPTEGGNRYFKAFEFGRSGEEKRLPAERVFYHWRPKADDWRQPESVLQAARLDVSVAVMQDRYDYAFLRNDARPASVVIHEGFATEDDETAFKRAWHSDFRGPDNAGKTHFVEADPIEGRGLSESLVVKTLGLSQRDAEFVKRYEAKLRAICVAFGTPLSKLGDASGRTFSNAGEENRNWWQDTILPDLDEFADAVNIKLAPLFGENVGWFDLSGVEALRPRRVSTDVGVPSLMQSMVMTVNEGRAELSLPPIDGGDRLLTVEEITALKGGQAPAEPRSAVGAVPAGRAAEDATQGVEVVAAVPEPAPTPPPEPSRAVARRAVAVISSTTNVEVLEAAWERTFRRLFKRQLEAVLARLNGKRGRQKRASVDAVFDPSFWRNATEDEAQGLLESVVTVSGSQISAQFGVAFDVTSPRIQRFIEGRVRDLAGQVTDTTYAALRDELTEGTMQGEGIPELARRIEKVFDVATETRATTIARTEVISAYNGAAVAVAETTGADVVGGQEWISTGDGRTRPEHSFADGQIVGMGEPFLVGGEALEYPGDPAGSAANTVNCRCTVAFLTPEEMGERRAFVEIRHARAVLALIGTGSFDGAGVREALRMVAA